MAAHLEQEEKQQQDELMEEDDEIDIIGINKEDEQLNNNSQEFTANTICTETEEDFVAQLGTCSAERGNVSNFKLISSFETDNVVAKCADKTKRTATDASLLLAECETSPASKDCKLFEHSDPIQQKSDGNDDNGGDSDRESLSLSANTSPLSSKMSSRRNSLEDSDSQRNFVNNVEVGHEAIDSLIPDVSDDDEDDKEGDPYKRFFFESDYLALKDNKHYHLLLQTLVALEGQRMQAIKDLDTLCEEEAKALDDPIGFVEKLQNNEPLGLPQGQAVIKVPRIPWETYATSLGNVDISFPMMQHNTRSSTSSLADKAPQEAQPMLNIFGNEHGESNSSDVAISETARSNDISGKLPTYNQTWTNAEQTRLEKLLQVYPQEEIESKRWEKIAKALGNRTPKQVASRVQKYFIKLAKAGLPIPGRVPNIPRSGSRINKRSSHYQTLGFRNSTFFPSYQPRVYMNDNRDDDDESSIAFSDDASCISDEESIPEEMKQTPDYMELVELKRIKRQKIKHENQTSTSHVGFMCDGCGVDPIVGTRWHCQDCPPETSLDFCSACIDRGIPASRGHDNQHHFEPITKPESFFVDGDYVCSTGSSGTGYNYLDPNFLPAAS